VLHEEGYALAMILIHRRRWTLRSGSGIAAFVANRLEHLKEE
jgi:hypothetical protein